MNRPLDESALRRCLRRVLPRPNNFGGIDLRELQAELRTFGIDTPCKLRKLLLTHRREAIRLDRQPFDELNARIQRSELGDERYEYLRRRRIFLNWAGLVRVMLELQFGDRYRDSRLHLGREGADAV
jgi:hypothetical protein